jgi:hypothetical protein
MKKDDWSSDTLIAIAQPGPIRLVD